MAPHEKCEMDYNAGAISELPCASVSKRGLLQNLSNDNEFHSLEREAVSGTHFHMIGFAQRLVLTERQKVLGKAC